MCWSKIRSKVDCICISTHANTRPDSFSLFYFVLYTNLMQLDLSVFVLNLFSSVQPFSHVGRFATPWTPTCQASLCITNSWSLLKLMFIELVMPSNLLILCHSFLLQPSILLQNWSFSFSINPFNEYSSLISFRIDWLDLLAVHSSKAAILRRSAFFIVQLWHPYMTTGKTIALTRWTSVKMMFIPP